jgi:ABC-type spermidine/putrescine transport system permease subunit II
LRAKYLAGGIGTYTTSNPGSSALWTKSMGEPPEEPGTPGLDFRLITTGNNKDTYCVYKGTVTGGSVVIPAAYNGRSVTEIGDEAFSGTILTSITIPTSVMSIGNYAFADCTELTSVTFKDGSQLTTIGNYAFRQCTGLANITIPESVTTIGEGAFVYCTSLGTITFAATSELLSIGSEAFSNCGLTNITIPESVTEIGAGAFFECNSLGSITIPEGVTFIGANTFGRCTSLAGVTIPESVESIGNWAFNGCTSLISVTFKGIITSDNFSSFNSFPGDLRDKYLENGGGIGTWTRDVNGSTPDVWTER